MGFSAMKWAYFHICGHMNELEGLIHSKTLPQKWLIRGVGGNFWIEAEQISNQCTATIKLLGLSLHSSELL